MIQTKPLATRVDGMASKGSRVQKGVPVSKGFASFMGGEGAAPGANTAVRMTAEERATQGGMGMAQTKAMATLARVMQESQTPLKTANSLQAAQNTQNPMGNLFARTAPQRPSGAEGAETAVRVSSHRKKQAAPVERMAALVKMDSNIAKKTTPPAQTAQAGQTAQGGETDAEQLGTLAARFESGSDGIAAIGYDRHGGTSYGKFQLSSRAGSMRGFIDFMKKEEPEWAARLDRAGASNTGSKRGRMPEVWQQLAQENPGRFEDLQDRYIRTSHFMPAVEAVAQKTGVAFDDMPSSFKEVLFSTAVQHGPAGAARIVSRAMTGLDQGKLDPEKNAPEVLQKAGETLIRRIYALRSGQFGSSTAAVQSAVKNRLREEMGMALSMLQKETAGMA